MGKKILTYLTLFLVFCCIYGNIFGQVPDKRILYITDDGLGDIDNSYNRDLMDDVFGEGGWEEIHYTGIDTTGIFSTNTCMIFFEGSYDVEDEFTAFYDVYRSTVEQFVFNGGYVYINFRSFPGFSYFLGFDSIWRTSDNSVNINGTYIDINDPIFNDPYYPITNPISLSPGAYANSRGTFSGVDFDTLIIDDSGNRVCLLEKSYGAGKLICSQFYHIITEYSAEHLALRKNILWYLAPCLHSSDDMGVYDLILPDDACNLSEEEIISVVVHNFGYDDQDTFQMSYSIDDGEVTTETFTTNIPAYLSDTLAFFTPGDFSVCGAHTVKVWTTLPGDTIPQNDTLYYTVTNICSAETSTGIPTEVCAYGGLITAEPEVALGYWEGEGITDTANGVFDPELVGLGNSSVISYTYSTAIGYTKTTIPYTEPVFTDPVILTLTDEDVDTVVLPFDFMFFSGTYDTIYVSSNGFARFGEPYIPGSIFIPSPGGINNLLALAGYDLVPSLGSIYYSVEGMAPNRRFQLKYDNVHLYFPGFEYVNVSAILYESTNIIDIVVHYLPVVDAGGIVQGISNIDGSQYYLTKTIGNPLWFIGANDTAFRFTPTLCPRTIVDTITVIGDVSKNVLGTDTLFCWGDSITIQPDTTSSYYLWNTGDTTQEITVDAEGYYSVEMEYLPGCALFDTLFAEEIDSIALTFTTTPVILGISDGSASVEVAAGGLPPFTYLWGTGETTPDIIVEESGLYGVTVTDAFGCTTFGTVVVGEDVAIDNINQSDLLSIYPNPAHNALLIDIKDTFGACSVDIYTLTGASLIAQNILNNQTSLNISTLHEGLYAIVIHIDDRVITGFFEKF